VEEGLAVGSDGDCAGTGSRHGMPKARRWPSTHPIRPLRAVPGPRRTAGRR